MKRLLPALLALLSVLALAGCGMEEILPRVEETLPKVEEVLPKVEEVLPIVEETIISGPEDAEAQEPEDAEAQEPEDAEAVESPAEEQPTVATASPEPVPAEELSTASTTAPVPEPPTGNAGTVLSEDGSYDSRDDVALYLVTYRHLPDNYITKSEARALGWNGGGLEKYAPGKCIGGDTFGNREGVLPKGHTYTECDIDTLGESSRGAKRIVFSEDFSVYYTGNHYESFETLYVGGTKP